MVIRSNSHPSLTGAAGCCLIILAFLTACTHSEPWEEVGISQTQYTAWQETIDAESSMRSLAATMAKNNRLMGLDIEAFKTMVISIEDPNFRNHGGFDVETPGVGPATITQDVATRYDPIIPQDADEGEYRKGVARGIEEVLTKDQILDFYLADLRYGGAERAFFASPSTAARDLFDKEIGELDRDQMIVLVAAIHYRESWNPDAPLEVNMRNRIARITALLDGLCKPEGPSDDLLIGCQSFDPTG